MEDKKVCRLIDVEEYNKDMELIEKYCSLTSKVLKRMQMGKDVNIKDFNQCMLMIQAIDGYANISRKDYQDRKSARNYLRINSAGKCGYGLIKDFIEGEYKDILEQDALYKEIVEEYNNTQE